MDWIKYYNEHTPEINSVGKCLKECEVNIEDGLSCYEFFSSVACWFGWYV